MYLQQRDRTKEFLMEAEAMDGGGATKIHVYLMHLVVEQTCLGLIRLFLGYMPNYHNLSFLFELCEYFTPLTAELFPRETQKDRDCLKYFLGILLRSVMDLLMMYCTMTMRCSTTAIMSLWNELISWRQLN
jgi:hypothetical protein